MPSIRIDRIEISDGQIAFRDAKMTAPEVLSIRALTLTSGAADQPVSLTMAASAGGAPFTLSGRIGPFGALFGAPGQKLDIDLALAASGAGLSLAGTIADPTRLSGVDLRVRADIPDLAALSGLARTELPPLRAIAGQTGLTDLDGKGGLLAGFALRDLRLAAPQIELGGEISVTRLPRPFLGGSLRAARIDLDALRAAKPVPAPAAAVATPAPGPGPVPTRLIPDRELPLDRLRAVDADLNLAIGELTLGGVAYRDLSGHLVLRDGALRLDPFTAILPGGPVRASLAIDAGRPVPPVALVVSAPSLALAPFLAAFALPAYAEGNLRLDADLRGAGRSPHQIAATLDGSVGLSMENAQFDAKRLGEALNSVEMLRNLKPGFTALRCLAVRMDLLAGAGTSRALLLDTAPLRLSGSGGVNLGEETLALRLVTTIRLGATGIAAPLNINGTFLAPKVTIDAARPSAGAGTGAGAPFGLSIGKLGLDQLLPGAVSETCAHDLAIARGQTPPESLPQAPTEPGGKPADLLRRLLR